MSLTTGAGTQSFLQNEKLILNYATVREFYKLQLQELEEFRRDAYKNAKVYKEKTNKWHDAYILARKFEVGQ